jgi:flagellar biosynthesis protein FliP
MTEYIGIGLSLILSIRTMPTTVDRVYWDGAEPDSEYQNDAHH